MGFVEKTAIKRGIYILGSFLIKDKILPEMDKSVQIKFCTITLFQFFMIWVILKL